MDGLEMYLSPLTQASTTLSQLFALPTVPPVLHSSLMASAMPIGVANSGKQVQARQACVAAAAADTDHEGAAKQGDSNPPVIKARRWCEDLEDATHSETEAARGKG